MLKCLDHQSDLFLSFSSSFCFFLYYTINAIVYLNLFLLEAVEEINNAALIGLITIDPADLMDYSEAALDNARRFKEYHQTELSIEEIASINFYTMQFPVPEQSPYFVMNAALRNEDRNQLKPFVKYLWLFMHAFKKVVIKLELKSKFIRY
jgi:hypothetical protein